MTQTNRETKIGLIVIGILIAIPWLLYAFAAITGVTIESQLRSPAFVPTDDPTPGLYAAIAMTIFWLIVLAFFSWRDRRRRRRNI